MKHPSQLRLRCFGGSPGAPRFRLLLSNRRVVLPKNCRFSGFFFPEKELGAGYAPGPGVWDCQSRRGRRGERGRERGEGRGRSMSIAQITNSCVCTALHQKHGQSFGQQSKYFLSGGRMYLQLALAGAFHGAGKDGVSLFGHGHCSRGGGGRALPPPRCLRPPFRRLARVVARTLWVGHTVRTLK